MRGHIAEGYFSFVKFNVTLNCLCGQSDCWRAACGEIPTSGPLRIVLGGVQKNPDIVHLKITPSHEGSGPPSNTWFLEPTQVST